MRHADNPNFGFLNSGHPLYDFFQFVLENSPEIAPLNAAPPAPAAAPADAAPVAEGEQQRDEPAAPLQLPEGVREPAADVRGIIDKLVEYIGRNGASFQETARAALVPRPRPFPICRDRDPLSWPRLSFPRGLRLLRDAGVRAPPPQPALRVPAPVVTRQRVLPVAPPGAAIRRGRFGRTGGHPRGPR